MSNPTTHPRKLLARRIRERKRWRTPWTRRYRTACFTIRTVCLVGQSLWACLGGKTRAAIVTALGVIGLDRLVQI
jgi:hypothetical protein